MGIAPGLQGEVPPHLGYSPWPAGRSQVVVVRNDCGSSQAEELWKAVSNRLKKTEFESQIGGWLGDSRSQKLYKAISFSQNRSEFKKVNNKQIKQKILYLNGCLNNWVKSVHGVYQKEGRKISRIHN